MHGLEQSFLEGQNDVLLGLSMLRTAASNSLIVLYKMKSQLVRVVFAVWKCANTLEIISGDLRCNGKPECYGDPTDEHNCQ